MAAILSQPQCVKTKPHKTEHIYMIYCTHLPIEYVVLGELDEHWSCWGMPWQAAVNRLFCKKNTRTQYKRGRIYSTTILVMTWCNLTQMEYTQISDLLRTFHLKQNPTRPTLERRATLCRLRSINPNMINHFTSQSQTSLLFENQNT